MPRRIPRRISQAGSASAAAAPEPVSADTLEQWLVDIINNTDAAGAAKTFLISAVRHRQLTTDQAISVITRVDAAIADTSAIIKPILLTFRGWLHRVGVGEENGSSNVAKAEACYNAALRSNPTYAPALYNLGLLEERIKENLQKSREFYQQAADLGHPGAKQKLEGSPVAVQQQQQQQQQQTPTLPADSRKRAATLNDDGERERRRSPKEKRQMSLSPLPKSLFQEPAETSPETPPGPGPGANSP